MADVLCPLTGELMVRGERLVTLNYKDESITFHMPGWYSDHSDEGVHSGEDMRVSDRMLNLLKARVDGLLEPNQIKIIRRKLNLTQAEAGELIGGGPRAFQKYEAGDLLPSRAICSALRLLEQNPGGLSALHVKKVQLARKGKSAA
jgi:HTH-type transcriptional regulator/antitoxin MqsA